MKLGENKRVVCAGPWMGLCVGDGARGSGSAPNEFGG